eukprot:GHVH01005901.1.p1 GENE.GHVH01005901.1~~GHVH01005901.1.p1  ORF type:complete len:368 (+),score=46.47 GHVH01005901.1:850-1953(+)
MVVCRVADGISLTNHWIRLFSRGQPIQKSKFPHGHMPPSENRFPQERGRELPRTQMRRASSVVCRRSSSQTKEAEIQGLAMFLMMPTPHKDQTVRNPVEWDYQIRSHLGHLSPEKPVDQRVVVIATDMPAVLWGGDPFEINCFSAGSAIANFAILQLELRSLALKEELHQNVSEWKSRRHTSGTLRRALENPPGGSYRRSASNSRDTVPDWAKRIQDSRPDLGFSGEENPCAGSSDPPRDEGVENDKWNKDAPERPLRKEAGRRVETTKPFASRHESLMINPPLRPASDRSLLHSSSVELTRRDRRSVRRKSPVKVPLVISSDPLVRFAQTMAPSVALMQHSRSDVQSAELVSVMSSKKVAMSNIPK